ncbi:unnamed protein product [Pedinophyceae sp. YPF-701]|nr:unnamed protein product [Pedinophyceae sp. YPF-701]
MTAAEAGFEMPKDMDAYFKIAKDPLVRYSNMTQEMREEAVDIIVGHTEKHPKDYEKAASLIKENLDKKFGTSWHVVVGQSYSYEVTCEAKQCIYLLVMGSLGVLSWKH